MSNLENTNCFVFGSKVKFLRKNEVHPDLRDKDFCLIGFNDNAFSLIEWEKKGGYEFEFYSGNVYTDLSFSE